MKIVIDIPKKTYEQLKFFDEHGILGFDTIIDEAVANGTPLRCVFDKMKRKINEFTFKDAHGEKFIFRDRLNHILNEVESEGNNGTL